MDVTCDASLIFTKLLYEVSHKILKELKTIEGVERYLSFYAIIKDYNSVEVQKVLFEDNIEIKHSIYKQKFGEKEDKEVLKNVFGLN